MHSLRFLFSRRWGLFAVAIVVVAAATWWLGQWQFDRLADRKERNEVVRANEDGDPVLVENLLMPGGTVADEHEWLIVGATGTYAVEDTVIVRYRTRDGISGVDVVVPLVTANGTAVLVDRGWMATDDPAADVDDVPAPPGGEVTITGWLRGDGTGDSTAVANQSTRAINSRAIGDALDREVYGGFVELRSEDPPPATPLERVELPELDNGPHFFYGLQWWFFGVLAIFGFFYLMYDEWRIAQGRGRPKRGAKPSGPKPKKVRQSNHPYVRAQREAEERAEREAQSARTVPTTGSVDPDTNGARGEGANAAARPSSPGPP